MAVIPQIISLLGGGHAGVCGACAILLGDLSEHGKLLYFLCRVLLIRTVAEFRESIRDAVPRIIDLLSDDDTHARRASAYSLAKLSVQGEVTHSSLALLTRIVADFRESIDAAIPLLVALLSYSEDSSYWFYLRFRGLHDGKYQ